MASHYWRTSACSTMRCRCFYSQLFRFPTMNTLRIKMVSVLNADSIIRIRLITTSTNIINLMKNACATRLFCSNLINIKNNSLSRQIQDLSLRKLQLIFNVGFRTMKEECLNKGLKNSTYNFVVLILKYYILL